MFHFFQAGKYVWKTYKEVYDLVVKVGNSARACGYGEVCHPIVLLGIIYLKLIICSYYITS